MRSQFCTGSTVPMPTPRISVLLCKLVPALAMRLSAVFISIKAGVSSHSVLSVRYCLKMLWINAEGITTKMVKLQTFGHFTLRPFIGQAMRKLLTTLDMEISIPMSDCRLPNPATVWTRFINLQPKPLLRCKRPVQVARRWVAMSKPSVVMNYTVAMPMHISNAVFNGTLLSHNTIITREHQWR